jgi:transposase
MPECYVPPAEIEHLRLLTRNRKDLAHKVTLVKNQAHALVTRNLLDAEMKGVSDWFGVGGLHKLAGLPLPSEERAHLARHLEQLELLARQEESMQVELAQVARDRKDVKFLMTIPGINFYSAVGILAEIGDIKRFPDKQHLASYAGLVPKSDNSGDRTSENRPVKKGNMVLKSFLCTAVKGMLRSGQKTAVTEFYREKVKSRPEQKAQVAAARKLSGEIWKILTFEVPYREEDADLTARKEKRMTKMAEEPTPVVSSERMQELADLLSGKAEVLQRLQEEAGDEAEEVSDAG